MKKYNTPEIKIINYEMDRMIMEDETDPFNNMGGQDVDNPWDDILDPTTSAGSASSGLSLKM